MCGKFCLGTCRSSQRVTTHDSVQPPLSVLVVVLPVRQVRRRKRKDLREKVEGQKEGPHARSDSHSCSSRRRREIAEKKKGGGKRNEQYESTLQASASGATTLFLFNSHNNHEQATQEMNTNNNNNAPPKSLHAHTPIDRSMSSTRAVSGATAVLAAASIMFTL